MRSIKLIIQSQDYCTYPNETYEFLYNNQFLLIWTRYGSLVSNYRNICETYVYCINIYTDGICEALLCQFQSIKVNIINVYRYPDAPRKCFLIVVKWVRRCLSCLNDFLFIFYLLRCTLPNFSSVYYLAYLLFLSCQRITWELVSLKCWMHQDVKKRGL